MTQEELEKLEKEADEYAKDVVIFPDPDTGKSRVYETIGEIFEDVKKAYIDGSIRSRVEWHNLKKNPKDLPDSNRPVFAVARVGGNRQYPYLAQYWKGSKVEWCCWRNNMQRELVEPDAWCEIPTFEE